MTSRSLSASLCALAVAVGVAAAPRAARASAADAFENKVKPVSGQLYTKAGKIELTPNVSLSMNDAFFSKALAGVRVGYHLTEHWSVAVSGAYAFSNGATGSTTVCASNTGCQPAEPWRLYQVPGYLKYVAGAEVAFAPVYGKLNLFAEKALHFDSSIFAGGDLVGYRDVVGAADAQGGVVPADATSPGGHVGLGARVFLGRSWALDLQVKDVLYRVKGLTSGNLQNQLFAQAGLSFFLPVSSRAQ